MAADLEVKRKVAGQDVKVSLEAVMQLQAELFRLRATEGQSAAFYRGMKTAAEILGLPMQLNT